MNLLDQLNDKLEQINASIKGLDETRKELSAEASEIESQIRMIVSMLQTTQEAFNTLMLSQKTGALTDDDFRTFAQEAGLKLLPEFETGEEDSEEGDEEAAGID